MENWPARVKNFDITDAKEPTPARSFGDFGDILSKCQKVYGIDEKYALVHFLTKEYVDN